MGEVTKKDSPSKTLDRVLLKKEAAERIDKWRSEIRQAVPGFEPTRSEVANHFILVQSDTLSSNDIKAIKDRYFDELAFAAWVFKSLKDARAQGQPLTFDELAKAGRSAPRPPSPRKKTPTPQSESDGNSHVGPESR